MSRLAKHAWHSLWVQQFGTSFDLRYCAATFYMSAHSKCFLWHIFTCWREALSNRTIYIYAALETCSRYTLDVGNRNSYQSYHFNNLKVGWVKSALGVASSSTGFATAYTSAIINIYIYIYIYAQPFQAILGCQRLLYRSSLLRLSYWKEQKISVRCIL